MADYLEIGRIVNTHGLKGELKVTPWCDDISVFEQVGQVVVDQKVYPVLSASCHKHSYLVKLQGIETVEQAELLKNKILLADKKDMPPLPQGVYYIADLLGMAVFDEQGQIGTLTDWLETGSRMVYVVSRPQKGDLLLPNIPDVIRKVDIEARRMDVHVLEGLDEYED